MGKWCDVVCEFRGSGLGERLSDHLPSQNSDEHILPGITQPMQMRRENRSNGRNPGLAASFHGAKQPNYITRSQSESSKTDQTDAVSETASV
jgi:hypothetical protein